MRYTLGYTMVGLLTGVSTVLSKLAVRGTNLTVT